MVDELDARRGRGGARRVLLRFGGVAAVAALLALAAGLVFAQGEPRQASRLLLRDLVIVEPVAPDGTVVGAPLPTSGPPVAPVAACGVRDEPLTVDAQVAHLAAGIVLVQHAADLDAAQQLVLANLADADRPVLVAPSPAVEDGVVATAWTRRLVRREVEEPLLEIFVTAYAGGGPDPAPCP